MNTKTGFEHERKMPGKRDSFPGQSILGALAANFAAISFIIGFGLYFTLLMDAGYPRLDTDPLPQLRFLAEHQMLLHAWYLMIYIFFGISLAFLCLVLDERLKRHQPTLIRSAWIFGLLWVVLVVASGLIATVGHQQVLEVYARNPAQAASVWLSLQTLVNALGGGNEIIGGLWLTMVNGAGLKAARLPKLLSLLGLVIGIAGVLTAVPGMDSLMVIFGFGCILWFGGLSALFFSEYRQAG